MYTKGQTLKITATEDSPYRKLYGDRALIVTVVDVEDSEIYVQFSPEDAALNLNGNDQIRIVFAASKKWDVEIIPMPVQAEPIVEIGEAKMKKPVYTIDIEDVDWHRDNVAAWGSGRIEMGSPKGFVEKQFGKNTLIVEFIKHRPGALEDTPQEIVEILAAHLVNAEGVEFAPPDLIARIEIAEHRRIWNGAYVDDAWLSASEIASKYSLATATVRQAINRAVASGKTPTWARKSAGTWLIERDEADRRWGNRNG